MKLKPKILLFVGGFIAAIVGFSLYVNNRAQNVRGTTVPVQDGVVQSTRDPDLAAAVLRSKHTLDDFIKRFQNPQPGDLGFGINARMVANGKVEQLWIRLDSYADGVFTGRLADDPLLVKGLKKGDTVMVKKDEVSDWIYSADGKQVGGFTMEVLKRQAGR